MEIRRVEKKEFPQVAQLIAAYNAKPETQCIHSGEGVEAILKQIEIWDEGDEILFVAGWQDGELVAVFGSEYDVADGKSWLWGPFVQDEETAVSLFNHLLTHLPPEITQLTSYLHEANQAGNSFYQQQGFVRPRVAHVYVAPRPDQLVAPQRMAVEMASTHSEALIGLHKQTFPTTWFSGKEIVSKLGEKDKVFVFAEGEQLLGYIYARLDEASAEGYVEFLGVDKVARGQGLGRLLLQTAVYWLFSTFSVPQIALNVDDGNDNARGLYESAGFHLHFTGVAMSRKR
ncbi:MAG: GNAT family N-acetyltransferase [Chloroflexota bacterium]